MFYNFRSFSSLARCVSQSIDQPDEKRQHKLLQSARAHCSSYFGRLPVREWSWWPCVCISVWVFVLAPVFRLSTLSLNCIVFLKKYTSLTAVTKRIHCCPPHASVNSAIHTISITKFQITFSSWEFIVRQQQQPKNHRKPNTYKKIKEKKNNNNNKRHQAYQ